MRYVANYDDLVGETSVELIGNCHTDAYPMLRRITFRKQDIDLQSQSLPLACAILTAGYCGEIFEFSGIKIGNDYASAIRTIIGSDTQISLVDGLHRTISLGEVDILCERASIDPGASLAPRPQDSVPFTRIDWSGDFVDTRLRSSARHAFGAYQTNAGFFADDTRVSIALGLLHGRDRCRTLYVRRDAREDREQIAAISTALWSVGVSLQVVD